MQSGFRVARGVGHRRGGVASSFVPTSTPPSQAAEIQLQLGDVLFAEGRYLDALDAYRNALKVGADRRRPRGRACGVDRVGAARRGVRPGARRKPRSWSRPRPRDPESMTLYGDALWASGLFEEAEAQYRDALALAPELARGHHGMARVARRAQPARRGDERGAGGAAAVAARSRDPPHRRHDLRAACTSTRRRPAPTRNYVNLLPNKDHSEKADWSRAEIRFLRSFGQRVPFEMRSRHRRPALHRRLPAGERQGRRARQGQRRARRRTSSSTPASENTVITRPTAQRLGITPITYTLSAGVGDVGLRGLQLARIDSLELGSLKLRNVPCLIKNPPLRDIPVEGNREPVAARARLLDDHRLQDAQAHLRQAPAGRAEATSSCRCGCTAWRRCAARSTATHLANFVVDTGGEVISISQATATALGKPETGRQDRAEGVRHVGLGSATRS